MAINSASTFSVGSTGLKGLSSLRTHVAIDEPGNVLFVADDDTIKLFDLKSRRKLRELGFSAVVDGIAVSPDERYLAALEANFGRTQMHIFDYKSGRLVAKTPEMSASGTGVYFTRDSKHVVLRGVRNAAWGEPMFHLAATGELYRTLPFTFAEIYFAKDGTTLIGGDEGDTAISLILLSDMFDDQLQKQHTEFPPGIQNWHRDGHYLVLRIEVDGRSTRELLRQLAATSRAWKLDLSNSGNLTDDTLALIKSSPNIYGLNLASIYTDRISAAGVKSLATLPNLHELRIHEPDDEMVCELAKLTQLRVLEINRSEADAETFKLLAELKGLRELTLHLDNEQMEVALGVLKELPELTTLRLNWAGDTEEGLAALGMLPELRHLKLSSCDNLNENQGLARLTNVKELVIDVSPFKDGLGLLSGLENLEGLDLRNTGLRQELTLPFKNLKWLRMPWNTDELIATIREQHPEVRVFSK